MRRFTVLQVALAILLAAVLLAAPRILTIVQTRMLTEIIYFSLFAVSFNLLFANAGLLSFGHAAYFGLGAYVTAISLKHVAGMPFFAAILLGALAGTVGGIVIGFFCVRRKGSYFALLTLAFNQFLWAIAWKWREVTGGDDGIGGIVPKKPVDLGIVSVDFNNVTNKYYLILIIVVLCLAVGWYLMRTPFGNTVMAVKGNDERASFLGYNVNRSKLLIFSLAACFAGIAGSLFALFQDFVAPSAISMAMSTEVLFMAFLGGTGSFFGPILGAAIFVYFTDWISSITDRWEFILGLLFIALVLYFHQGFIGLIPSRLKSLFAIGENR
ncbi:MAG: branched-chain amino acid ABC transporter permease [Desulfomonile tiedjei]|nr:branched-chain amino acid ABC transporter permease [Desulfomonile tiedjei]